MATLLWQRDVASTIDGVKTAFSSWDNCMAKAYCKWPVIAAITIASLIFLSLLWCLFRCLCCGVECCCGCFACCNACCPSPRRHKSSKYRDEPESQPFRPQQQLRPMQYQSPMPPAYVPPSQQSAQFDAPSKQFNGDALPAMPSWQTAQSRRVEVEEIHEPTDNVEMDHLPHSSRDEVKVPMLSHAEYAGQPPLASPYASAQEHVYGPRHDQAAFAGSQYNLPQNYQDAYRGASSPPPLQSPVQKHSGQGYGMQRPYAEHPQGGGMSPSYRGPQHNGPISPISPTYSNTAYTGYAPSGSTRYEPAMAGSYLSYHQPQSPSSFQGQGQQVGRKPVNGSWRDI